MQCGKIRPVQNSVSPEIHRNSKKGPPLDEWRAFCFARVAVNDFHPPRMASNHVKFGSVKIEIAPWTHPSGRKYFRGSYYESDGTRRHITRSTLKKAKDAAFEKAQELAKGVIDLAALSPNQIRAIRRMMEADPQLALVDEFLAWKAKSKPEKLLSEAAIEFLAVKQSNRGNSIQNYDTLKKFIDRLSGEFAGRVLSSLTVAELAAFVAGKKSHSQRTRKNNRASLVTFFRWCRANEYLPDETTAAERTEKPIVSGKIPDTYTPEELAILFKTVRRQYLPWLACAAFAGIRTDELYPLDGGEKSPLDWSDFKWDRGIIIVRPETDKNKQRRVVPILPALYRWLYPVMEESGPLVDWKRPPSKGKTRETKILGDAIGGWKRNALRHSFISYRAADVGLAQTAMEAGNSEAEAKKSYNDAKSKAEAVDWFSV